MKFIYFLFLILFLNACYYDNEEEILGTSGCTTTNMSYKNNIAPLIQASCNSCHSASAKLGNVVLDDFTNVKKYVANNVLIAVIKQNTGYSPMPKNSAKLDTCSIAKIESWIKQGALNN
jgi:uncharacterized protein CbrC (UPF0167 family)